MFIFKNLLFFSIIILISSCAVNNFKQYKHIKNYSIEIETPNDRYNLYFKENLKRFFNTNNNKKIYKLKTTITFETTETLSVSGQNVLKSTKAIIDYQLTNKNTNFVKSGSIKTFPALSSSSNFFILKENSIEFIKERLTKLKKIFIHE